MEMPGSCVVEEKNGVYVSISRGGPIYVPDMVGPLIGVTDFESSLLDELEDLKGVIGCDSGGMCRDDTSVDELKILTEEELADKAFQVAFKDSEVMGNFSQISDEYPNAGEIANGRTSDVARMENSERALNGSPQGCADNGELSKSVSKKRKRRHTSHKDDILSESCMAKVKELARVKQKQDEDKAAARLHSFNGSSRISELVLVPSRKYDGVSSLRSTSSSSKVRLSNALEPAPVLYPEILLCIEVYHSKRTWLKTQELLVLGRQTLDELKDKIHCSTDEIMKKAGQDDRLGYFLIEDVFCNDLREPSAVDYSKPILDWIRDSKKDALEKWECIISGELQQKQKELLGSGSGPKLPQFKAVLMHKTCFRDLRFRLGAGYLYCHQGDCKHAIVIRDMRLINTEDLQNRTAYPVVTYQTKPRLQKCSVCKIYGAEKVTVDDKWAPENPCYFCDLCYYMLHYVNGSLLYNDFSVYDYVHE